MPIKILLCCFIFAGAVPVVAQPQIVNFKQLQQFLPQGDTQGYAAGKLTGETSTMMGFNASWAQITYTAASDSVSGTISIKITDMLNIPSYMPVPSPTNGDVSRMTPTGYERTIVYRDLRVHEIYDSAAHQAKLQSSLAERFLVEITGDGIAGPKALYGFLDKVDLDGLRKVAQTAGAQHR